MTTKSGYFSIERDNTLIAKGTHFWCCACLQAVPLDLQSKDAKYCIFCAKVLDAEKALANERDTWKGEYFTINGKKVWRGSEFQTGGKRYAVRPDGQTVCLGNTRNATDPPTNNKDVVSKLPTNSNTRDIPPVVVLKQDGGAVSDHDNGGQRHPGGRPRKESGFSRITEWRRRKEGEQGELL